MPLYDINVPPPEHNPDKGRLRLLGRKVRERLGAMPEAYKLPTEKAEVWALGKFVTPEECTRLMAMIDAVAQPSRAYDAAYDSGYRTSYSGDVDPNDPFVKKLQRRIDDLLGIDPSFGETIQGQRYLPGQQFQAHTDWFPGKGPYWDAEIERWGQRSFTAMAYLNPVEEGGNTDFPRLGFGVEPRPGTLLIWNNADPDGVPNPFTVHAGSPVVKGVKYIITKWYRAKKWH
jgi:prolyl 4-hydroxylase